jgi:hypothetical protein
MAIAVETIDPRNRPFEVKNVPMDKIRVSRDIQTREKIDPHTVDRYAELLQNKVEFTDDIEVYWDGFVYWVADGHHRHAAYTKVDRVRVRAKVREGNQRDALIHALGANFDHGLPRKREDIQRAIRMALEDEELGRYSARTIAKIVRCSPGMVDNMKKKLGKSGDTVVVTDKYGNEIEMDVSGQKERGKKSFSFSAPVNTYHDLPREGRSLIKDFLRVGSRMTQEQYAFLLSWVKGEAPTKVKEAGSLLTQLELEEEAAEPAEGDDGMRF